MRWLLLCWVGCLCLLVMVRCTSSQVVVVDAVRPSSASNQQPTKVTILGRHFDSTARAFLVRAGGVKIALAALRVMTPEKAEATLAAGSAPGIYDLLWEQGDKEARLGGAFEVLSGSLQIDIVDVGQGDATLIRTAQGKTVLIDAGREEDADALLAFLREQQVTEIDLLIATHYDADHVGGISKIVLGPDGRLNTADDRVPKEGWWDRGGFAKNISYSNARATFPSLWKRLDGQTTASFPTYDLGSGAQLRVLAANGAFLQSDGTLARVNCEGDENCRSIGTMISVGRFRFWTAGDLTGGGINTPDAEATLARTIGQIDIYRAHHHGSRTSSSQALLDVLQPQAILISAGRQNSYCHPSDVVLKRFSQIPTLRLFLTTSGIIEAEKCGSTTTQALSVFGNRASLNAGDIQIRAGEESFTVRVAGGASTAFQVR